MVNTIQTWADHQGTTISARTAPVKDDLVQVLADVQTDLTTLTGQRGNAANAGADYNIFSGNQSDPNPKSGLWTMNFNTSIQLGSNITQANYFWRAGGLVHIVFGKSQTGAVGDPEWNDLANNICGKVVISGTVGQTIGGTTYTGTTVIGGTGTPNIRTDTGWDQIVAGGANNTYTIVYRQFADTAPYTNNYIDVGLNRWLGNTGQLNIRVRWYNAEGDLISGGTVTQSGVTAINGTAATTRVYVTLPDDTYLQRSWVTTPAITSSFITT